MTVESYRDKNVVSLKDWRKNQELETLGEDISEYLGLLSFNELVTESHETAKELKTNPLNDDLALRSKLLLDEINQRLHYTSHELTSSIKNIGNKLNQGFDSRKDLF